MARESKRSESERKADGESAKIGVDLCANAEGEAKGREEGEIQRVGTRSREFKMDMSISLDVPGGAT